MRLSAHHRQADGAAQQLGHAGRGGGQRGRAAADDEHQQRAEADLAALLVMGTSEAWAPTRAAS